VPLNGLLANRVVDGLDGAVARATVATVRGAFLDIVLDFAFYAAFPHDYCLWLAGRSAGRSRLYAWAEGHDERLAVLAEELVRRNPDIIMTTGTPGTLATKRTTSNIPITCLRPELAQGRSPQRCRDRGAEPLNITGAPYPWALRYAH